MRSVLLIFFSALVDVNIQAAQPRVSLFDAEAQGIQLGPTFNVFSKNYMSFDYFFSV
jgi:hypothetical protein